MNATSTMKKNIIHVIYPGDSTSGFVVETQDTDDNHAILEQIFAEWNHGSGKESEVFIKAKKRSLSVNDIVCVNGTYYQCAGFGWDTVTPEYVTQLENEVVSHPRCQDESQGGAYFALSDIMWNRKKNTNVV